MNIEPNKEMLSKFLTWLFEKEVLYGEPFNQWWDESGCNEFLKWAKNKHDLEYKK